MAKRVDKILKIENREIDLTNLKKVFWPEEGYTKEDMIKYYDMISSYILLYLKDRPESMNRFPNGIKGKHFYQKNVDIADIPAWMETILIKSENNTVNYLLCQNKETLMYMANLGCIEFNPWSSRITNLENPDFLVIDLDPVEIGFEYVIEAALGVKKVCDSADVPCFPKTSGVTGIHIYIPMGAKYRYEQVKQFAKIIAVLTNEALPEITSIERYEYKRKGKVYLDYLQNNHSQTLAAPYSIRPVPGAQVSTPLEWLELKNSLRPSNFTIANVLERLKKVGDIFQPVLGEGVNIPDALEKLKHLS